MGLTGLIGRVLSFVRVTRNGAQISDVKVNPGGGPNVTAEHFAPPGDDSHPLPTDYAYTAPTPQRGRQAAVGYVDPINTPQAQPGEKRIYARDSDGAVVVEVWLKNDGEATIFNENGTVTLSPDGTITAENGNGSVTLSADGSILGQNGAGSFELQTSGDFVVNGVTIAANGAVTIPSSLTLNGKEIAEHNHSQANDSGGNTEQPTGPNN